MTKDTLTKILKITLQKDSSYLIVFEDELVNCKLSLHGSCIKRVSGYYPCVCYLYAHEAKEIIDICEKEFKEELNSLKENSYVAEKSIQPDWVSKITKLNLGWEKI